MVGNRMINLASRLGHQDTTFESKCTGHLTKAQHACWITHAYLKCWCVCCFVCILIVVNNCCVLQEKKNRCVWECNCNIIVVPDVHVTCDISHRGYGLVLCTRWCQLQNTSCQSLFKFFIWDMLWKMFNQKNACPLTDDDT